MMLMQNFGQGGNNNVDDNFDQDMEDQQDFDGNYDEEEQEGMAPDFGPYYGEM